MEQYPNTGQNPYEQPTPGSTPQYPNTGQPPYGQPAPGYPAQYPNTGQPPYGAPPQPGYPGTAPYGQPQTGFGGAPPTLAPQPTPRRSNRIVGGVIAGAVIVLLVVGGVIHVNGATGAVKGFFDDLFSYNFNSAFSRVCSDKQAALQSEFNTLESQLNQLKSQATFDTSGLVYKLKSGGLTSAVVTVSGNLKGTVSGTTNSAPITSTDVGLSTSGLGWCLEIVPDATSSPSN
jgi:hypothetical protein